MSRKDRSSQVDSFCIAHIEPKPRGGLDDQKLLSCTGLTIPFRTRSPEAFDPLRRTTLVFYGSYAGDVILTPELMDPRTFISMGRAFVGLVTTHSYVVKTLDNTSTGSTFDVTGEGRTETVLGRPRLVGKPNRGHLVCCLWSGGGGGFDIWRVSTR